MELPLELTSSDDLDSAVDPQAAQAAPPAAREPRHRGGPRKREPAPGSTGGGRGLSSTPPPKRAATSASRVASDASLAANASARESAGANADTRNNKRCGGDPPIDDETRGESFTGDQGCTRGGGRDEEYRPSGSASRRLSANSDEHGRNLNNRSEEEAEMDGMGTQSQSMSQSQSQSLYFTAPQDEGLGSQLEGLYDILRARNNDAYDHYHDHNHNADNLDTNNNRSDLGYDIEDHNATGTGIGNVNTFGRDIWNNPASDNNGNERYWSGGHDNEDERTSHSTGNRGDGDEHSNENRKDDSVNVATQPAAKEDPSPAKVDQTTRTGQRDGQAQVHSRAGSGGARAMRNIWDMIGGDAARGDRGSGPRAEGEEHPTAPAPAADSTRRETRVTEQGYQTGASELDIAKGEQEQPSGRSGQAADEGAHAKPSGSGAALEIHDKDLVRVKTIGRGAFGSVWHARWGGADVALKELRQDGWDDDPSLAEEWAAETAFLAGLRHPHIIDFFGVVVGGRAPAFVTEFMAMGSLRRVLNLNHPAHSQRSPDACGREAIPRGMRLRFMHHTATGMAFLHSRGVVHFDLKSDNLLLTGPKAQPICKVADFGLCKQKQATLMSTMRGDAIGRGTPNWMAPELVNVDAAGNIKVDERVDVFSFGIVLWEVLTGEVPFGDLNPLALLLAVKQNQMRPRIPDKCELPYRELMEACWAETPADRPSFQEIADIIQNMK